MALKPNYRQERTQKARARQLKKQDKQRRREEVSSRRKALQNTDIFPKSDASVTSNGDSGGS